MIRATDSDHRDTVLLCLVDRELHAILADRMPQSVVPVDQSYRLQIDFHPILLLIFFFFFFRGEEEG